MVEQWQQLLLQAPTWQVAKVQEGEQLARVLEVDVRRPELLRALRSQYDGLVALLPRLANLLGTAKAAKGARDPGGTVDLLLPALPACCRRGSSIGQFLSIQVLGLAPRWLSDKLLTCHEESEKSCSSSGGQPASRMEDPEANLSWTDVAVEDPGLAKAKAVAKRGSQEETVATSPTLQQALGSLRQMVEPSLLLPSSSIKERLRSCGESS